MPSLSNIIASLDPRLSFTSHHTTHIFDRAEVFHFNPRPHVSNFCLFREFRSPTSKLEKIKKYLEKLKKKFGKLEKKCLEKNLKKIFKKKKKIYKILKKVIKG
jgi:hypothetical protein